MDQLNGCLILDYVLYKRLKALAPHTGVMSLDTPYRVSDAVKIASPVIATTDNWFSKASDEPIETWPFPMAS
jgi:hypothetical protein